VFLSQCYLKKITPSCREKGNHGDYDDTGRTRISLKQRGKGSSIEGRLSSIPRKNERSLASAKRGKRRLPPEKGEGGKLVASVPLTGEKVVHLRGERRLLLFTWRRSTFLSERRINRKGAMQQLGIK